MLSAPRPSPGPTATEPASGPTATEPASDRLAPPDPPPGTFEVFDVTAFGAVGDGITDNMEAFRAAQIAVRDQGGGTIYLPPGDYLASPLPTDGPYAHLAQHLHDLYAPTRGPFEVGASNEVFALHTSNTTLLFEPGARLLHPTFVVDPATGYASGFTFIATGGASNISILGGELVGAEPYVDRHSVIGVWLRNADRVQIRNMKITGLRADGIRVDEYHGWPQPNPPDPQSSRRVVITGCHIEGCRKQSLLLRGASNVSIVGNTFAGSGGHGQHIASIDFEDHDTDGSQTMLVENQRFVGNVVEGSIAHGVVVSGRNNQPGIVIAGNHLIGNGGDGVFAGQTAALFGNTARGNTGAGVLFAGSVAVDQTVVANTLVGNGTYGLAHQITDASEARADKQQRDNVVVGNRASGNVSGQIQPDLASYEHDRLEEPAHPGVTTTNLVADNLERP